MHEDDVSDDVGNIQKIDNDTWMEFHPDGDYEEKWVRIAEAVDMQAVISMDYSKFRVTCAGYLGRVSFYKGYPSFSSELNHETTALQELDENVWRILE